MAPKTKTPAVCRPLVWFLWCRTWKTETPLDRSEASISRPQKQQHWPVIRFLGSGQQSKQLQPLLQWASSEEEWEFCAVGSSQFQQQLLWRKNPIWAFELPGFGFGSAFCQSQFFEPCKEWDSWKGIWLSDFSGLKWATHLNLSGNTKLKKERISLVVPPIDESFLPATLYTSQKDHPETVPMGSTLFSWAFSLDGLTIGVLNFPILINRIGGNEEEEETKKDCQCFQEIFFWNSFIE